MAYFYYTLYMNGQITIAHRGASAEEAENTFASFHKAIEYNMDMIELDVHLSMDGEVIVMHDETVDRTTDGSGSLHEMTLEEIKNVRCSNGETVPTLQEVIEITRGKIQLNIEVKKRKAAKKVLEIIDDNDISGETMVSSNFVHPLKLIGDSNATVKTALIFWATKTNTRQSVFTFFSLLLRPLTEYIIFKRAKKANVRWVNLMLPLASKRLTKKLHTKGYKVAAWVVNHPRHIQKMKANGVDAIMSDYPDRLLD